jgi:hypothetical protein
MTWFFFALLSCRVVVLTNIILDKYFSKMQLSSKLLRHRVTVAAAAIMGRSWRRSVWTFLNESKSMLGTRVLVVTAQDEASKELANRALFELQRVCVSCII